MTKGNPMSAAISRASASEWAMPFLGCLSLRVFTRSWNRSRSSARSIASGVVPKIGMPASSSALASLRGVLPTELHNHAMQRAVLLLNPQDFHHMLIGQRLEIQSVRGIIICAYGFRIAVDHNGLIALICERVAGVAAAIVKFNALPDPVWSAAQNNHFFAIRWPGFAFG